MSLLRYFCLTVTALALAAVAAVPARAAFIPIAQPNASYLAGTSLLPITDPDFAVVPSLTDGFLTVSFDVGMVALTVPTTWATWGSPPDTESSTPRVLWTNGLTSVTLTSSRLLTTFGLEAQPNTQFPSSITASFFNGASLVGEITRVVDGNGGARLFAASSTDPFDTVVLTSFDDFAIAQVRASAVPEPSSLALLASAGMVGLVVFGRRSWRLRRAARATSI